MNKFYLHIFIFFLLIPLSYADKIHMKNGDVLTGTVISKTKQDLKIKTSYSPEITVKWAHVEKIESSKDLVVIDRKGKVQNVNLIVAPDSDLVDQDNSLEKGDVHEINPESWKIGKGHKFTGAINIGLQYERGNSDTDETDIDVTAVYRTQDYRIRTYGEREKDKALGTTTSDNWLLKGKLDRFLSDRLYVSAFGLIEEDDFANLNSRRVFGPLVGYLFYDRPRFNLDIDAGVARVLEEYTDSDNDYFTGFAWTLETDYTLPSEVVKFYGRNTGVWSFNDSSKKLIGYVAGASVPIGFGIILSAETDYEYNSQPADGSDTVDITHKFKLGYAW